MKTKEFTSTKQAFLRDLELVTKAQGDPEVAHGIEDNMRNHLINLLAMNILTQRQAQQLAAICHRTNALDFDRWCA